MKLIVALPPTNLPANPNVVSRIFVRAPRPSQWTSKLAWAASEAGESEIAFPKSWKSGSASRSAWNRARPAPGSTSSESAEIGIVQKSPELVMPGSKS